MWHIFPSESCDALREYIRSKTAGDIEGDPIHNQQTYLTSADLKELEAQGIIPWYIYQREGQIVLIPAGCAHQVRIVLSHTSAAYDVLQNVCLGAKSGIYSQSR